MIIEIYNELSLLRFVFNGNTVAINKAQVKAVETLKGELLRIDLGEGVLKHITIPYTDVTYPRLYASRDELKTELLQMLASGSMGSLNTDNLATLANQEEIINLLGVMAGKLGDINVSIQALHQNSYSSPLLVDEPEPGITYKGYAAVNTLTSEPNWAILRIKSDNGVTSYKWADGNTSFDNIWDDRYTLNYLLSFTTDTGIR